jgi:hypothetical protein
VRRVSPLPNRAFDKSRSPAKTSASFARWCAPWTFAQKLACWPAQRYEMPIPVAGIVQVVKSSETSAHVITATSSCRGPVSINDSTKGVGNLARATAPLTGMLRWQA